jgi:transforming growth factor-beta-induced protein
MHLSLIIPLCFSFIALSVQQNSAPSLNDLLAEQKNLSSFSDFLTNSLPDLLSELVAQEASRQPITILAPSNAAFDKIPYYSVIGPAWGKGNLDAQREVMKYHILPGDITTDVLLPTFQFFPTWLTNSTFSNVTDGQRVGAVMQGGKLLFFVSGISNRSPSTITDLKFAGGFVFLQLPPIPSRTHDKNIQEADPLPALSMSSTLSSSRPPPSPSPPPNSAPPPPQP